MARDVLFSTPTASATLTLFSADVLAPGFMVVGSIAPGCGLVSLSAVRLRFSVMLDVSSMSALELRSAVLVTCLDVVGGVREGECAADLDLRLGRRVVRAARVLLRCSCRSACS